MLAEASELPREVAVSRDRARGCAAFPQENMAERKIVLGVPFSRLFFGVRRPLVLLPDIGQQPPLHCLLGVARHEPRVAGRDAHNSMV